MAKKTTTQKPILGKPTLDETISTFETIKLDGKSIMDLLKETMGDKAMEWVEELVNKGHQTIDDPILDRELNPSKYKT